MFKKPKVNNRFIIENCGMDQGVKLFVLTDKQTGIQYLSNWTGTGGGVTPLLDENGNPSRVNVDELKDK